MCVLRLLVAFIIYTSSVVADITPINPVNASGSDAQSLLFNAFAPTINSYVQSNTLSTNPPNDYGFFPSDTLVPPTMVISDPATVQLQSASNVRVYYLTPYAAPSQIPPPTSVNQDSLGFNINHNYMLTPDQQALIFNANGAPPPNQVTTAGQFVDLGLLSAGTFLDFFLIAKEATGSSTTYWNDPSQNPDLFPHLTMVQFLNTPYYLLAWEDANLAGETPEFDLYRDLFAVVEVNVAAPEPKTYAILAILLLATWCVSCKRNKKSVNIKI